MVILRIIGIACGAALLCVGSDTLFAQGRQLPPLSGRSLNEVDVRLPSDLPAPAAIVVFTFTQEQQSQADRWVRGLLQLKPDFPYFEVAVIKPVNSFVRGMIVAGMRRGIQDHSERDKFVTVFTSVERIAANLPCSRGADAVCLVVADRSGQIRRAISGEYSDAEAQLLLASLESSSSTEMHR